MLNRDDVASLGLADDQTFFTGNVGGGIKSKDDAPAFFALDVTRDGHRVYGGIVLTGGK